MFCSPFRRRKKRKDFEETYLTREEAWQMYFNKLDEEANYFTVREEEEEDICTCSTCIVRKFFYLYNVVLKRKLLTTDVMRHFQYHFILSSVQLSLSI